MEEPRVGQRYTLKNQPAAILTITRVWHEWNDVHRCNTHYIQYDIEHSDGRPASRECYSTRGNWDLGAYNQDLIEPELCPGIEIAPGEFSGCDAHLTGATDCPKCGPTITQGTPSP